MSRARLLLSESWQSIRQNLSTTVAATTTVLIGMCLLGLFIGLGTWVLSYSSHLQDELRVRVNFCTTVGMPECSKNATKAQEQSVGAALRRDPLVEHVKFITKAENLVQFKKDYPTEFAHGYQYLGANPLPDTWEVTTYAAADTPIVGKRVCRAHYAGVDLCATGKQFGEVGGVTWGTSITKRVISIGNVISLVFLIAVVLLVVASTLLIANTIRLSIFSRRREIEVMKLVGATNWFIRGPFMLEGLLTGLAGSVIAVFLLLLGKVLVLPSISLTSSSTPGVHALSFSLNALILVLAGLMLGAAGSGLTIRRFLRV
jgi:cell division transport system permease protein